MVDATATPPGARGVNINPTLGYASAVLVRSSIDPSCPALLSSVRKACNTGRTTFRRRSPHARLRRSASSGAVRTSAGGLAAERSSQVLRRERSFSAVLPVIPRPGRGHVRAAGWWPTGRQAQRRGLHVLEDQRAYCVTHVERMS